MNENKTRADYFFLQKYNSKQKIVALYYFVTGYISMSSFMNTVRNKILIPLKAFHIHSQAIKNATKYCEEYANKTRQRLAYEEDKFVEVTEEEQLKITNAIEFKQI